MILDGQGIYCGCKIYVVVNYNQGFRKTAIIYKNGKYVKSIGYAKYLVEAHLGNYISNGYEIDHINGDCTDDRIENLQVISKELNRIKEIYDNHNFEVLVKLICPNCGKTFDIEKRNFMSKINYCKYIYCSRSCSGKKTISSKYEDLSGSPFRNNYEYIIGYFYDLNRIVEIENIMIKNNVKFIKKYR